MHLLASEGGYQPFILESSDKTLLFASLAVALVALGAVIRGETYHFELVSNEQGSGINRVSLDTGVPIANGILTTEDDDQALARMQVKGADCAQAAVEMARLLKALA